MPLSSFATSNAARFHGKLKRGSLRHKPRSSLFRITRRRDGMEALETCLSKVWVLDCARRTEERGRKAPERMPHAGRRPAWSGMGHTACGRFIGAETELASGFSNQASEPLPTAAFGGGGEVLGRSKVPVRLCQAVPPVGRWREGRGAGGRLLSLLESAHKLRSPGWPHLGQCRAALRYWAARSSLRSFWNPLLIRSTHQDRRFSRTLLLAAR